MNYQPTSRAAWKSFRPISGKLDDQIIQALSTFADGLTSEEMEKLLKRKHQAVSGNLRHLVERNLVRDSGRLRRVDSGRNAIVWRLTPPVRPAVQQGELL